MHNKKINQLLIGAMLAAMAPAVSAADIPAWNGSALGFEAGQQGLLGDMLGIRPILEENGFHYNLGYLNEMAYNAGGGYDHDKHLAYIDQVALTFTQDLERWTGIPDARLEGNIVNRNHDDNLTTKRLQDPRATARSHAWSWSTKGSKGILLPMEIETRPLINGLPGAYNLGVVWTNAPQSDLYSGKSGGAGATDPQGYAEHDSTWFMYAGLNQQITRHADDPLRGMSVSLSGSLSDQRSNYIHSAVAASMRYRGLFDARPEDWIGFGLTWIDMSSHYARNQRYMNQISGATDYNDPAYQPVAGHSLNGELYYRFRPVSWLELQPGLQYWHRPGGVAQTQDAWVVEWKTVVTF
ncbi:carbohydrate porin [Klebsiella pneumoniae]